jgi:hypothetical protein
MYSLYMGRAQGIITADLFAGVIGDKRGLAHSQLTLSTAPSNVLPGSGFVHTFDEESATARRRMMLVQWWIDENTDTKYPTPISSSWVYKVRYPGGPREPYTFTQEDKTTISQEDIEALIKLGIVKAHIKSNGYTSGYSVNRIREWDSKHIDCFGDWKKDAEQRLKEKASVFAGTYATALRRMALAQWLLDNPPKEGKFRRPGKNVAEIIDQSRLYSISTNNTYVVSRRMQEMNCARDLEMLIKKGICQVHDKKPAPFYSARYPGEKWYAPCIDAFSVWQESGRRMF